MSVVDLLALTLGIVFFVLWVCIYIYSEALRRVHTQGRSDYLRHKNRSLEYNNVARVAYRRGRRVGAMECSQEVRHRLTHS